MFYLTKGLNVNTSGFASVVYRDFEESDFHMVSGVLGSANVDMLGTKIISVRGSLQMKNIEKIQECLPDLQIHEHSPPSLQTATAVAKRSCGTFKSITQRL